MKLFKTLVTCIMLISMVIISGCSSSNSEKFVGTWYGIENSKIIKIIVEKENDQYFLSASEWEYAGQNFFSKNSNQPIKMMLLKRPIYDKESVVVKDNVLQKDAMMNKIGPMVLKDNKMTGKVTYPAKNDVIYEKSTNIALPKILEKSKANLLEGFKKQGVDPNRVKITYESEKDVEEFK